MNSPLSNAERSKRWQEKRRGEGRRHVQFWADPPAVEALERIRIMRGGEDDKTIIEGLIVRAAKRIKG